MEIALSEAKIALDKGNIPIGACIVLDEEVISKAHNEVDSLKSDLMHAEMSAIQRVTDILVRNKRKAVIYSTLEPCAMCAGALVNVGIAQLVYGAQDKYVGAIDALKTNEYYYKKLQNVVPGVLAHQSQDLLNHYVQKHNCRHHLSG